MTESGAAADVRDGLVDAMLAITAGLDLEHTLQTIVRTAMQLVQARYGAELAAWRRTPLTDWAPGGESLPDVAARVRPAVRALLARLAEGRAPGTLDRSQVAGYREPAADHPWSIVVGHDGVFKVVLLTLFDLPLERFWMWSMDPCGITVIELRAGRRVVRAHNLTAHLAGAQEDPAKTEPPDDRGASGAL